MKPKLIGKFISHDCIVDLKEILPLGGAKINVVKPTAVSYSLDNKRYFDSSVFLQDKEFSFNNIVARYIKLDYDFEIEVYLGFGYVGIENKEWTSLFEQNQYWTGGDGLYTFNLKGKDQYNLEDKDVTTLCVFGDTFLTTLGKNNVRLNPIAMPNNSFCIINGKKPNPDNIKFFINCDEKGHCTEYMIPDNSLSFQGTMASNLVQYNSKEVTPYLSGYNPNKDIEIELIMERPYDIDYLIIYNYFVDSKIDMNYASRGVKNLEIYTCDSKGSSILKKVILEKADFSAKGKNFNKIEIDSIGKKIKLVIPNKIGVGNYGGANGKEPFFGMNKIYLHQRGGDNLIDVKADANSEFLKKSKHAWFWLQDGIIKNNKFYSLPLVVKSDTSQPDGFQFSVEGLAMVSIDIENEMIKFDTLEQKSTNLYQKIGGKEYLFGCAYFDNSFTSGNKDADGYIYIYGYTSMFFEIDYGKRMRVARVKEEDFCNINEWRFYNGEVFVPNMKDSIPVLDHISCEISVHKDGDDYICIFTYDVQSPYVAYAISKTPYGPFGQPRIAYVCPEHDCKHLYQYNAKGHPHLSSQGDILVSYNVNTSNFDENINYGRVYGPRFINLRKIGE